MAKSKKPVLFRLSDAGLEFEGGMEFPSDTLPQWDNLSWRRDDKKQALRLLSHQSDASLLDGWKPLRLNIERADATGDVVFLTGDLCGVSTKAAKVIRSVATDAVELLPIEVVGEIPKDRERPKPLAASGRPDLQLLIVRFFVELGESAEATTIEVDTEFGPLPELMFEPVFSAETIENRDIFRVAHGGEIFCSQKLRDAMIDAGLKGVSFVEVPYELEIGKKSPKPKPSLTPTTSERSVSPPRRTFDFTKLAAKKRASNTLWNQWVEHWNWIIAVMDNGRADVVEKVSIAKPATQRQLKAVERSLGLDMPADFADVLATHSRRVEFYWGIDEGCIATLPKSLSEVAAGGAEHAIWDIDDLVELKRDADGMVKMFGRDEATKRGWMNCLPFLRIGNGDYIAFRITEGQKTHPVVYMSHESDSEYHRKQLGANFVDFLTRWTNLGCPGPDFPYFQPFYDKRSKQLRHAGRAVDAWKKWLRTDGDW